MEVCEELVAMLQQLLGILLVIFLDFICLNSGMATAVDECGVLDRRTGIFDNEVGEWFQRDMKDRECAEDREDDMDCGPDPACLYDIEMKARYR